MTAPTKSPAAASDKLAYLRMVDIFQDLDEAQMQEIEASAPMFTCEPGRIFCHADDPAEVLFILKKGEVILSRINDDGKRLITATLEAGTIFGEMPIFGQRLQNSEAEALTECLICSMSRRDVISLMNRYPVVAIRIAQVLSMRLESAEERLQEMAFQGLRERLASLLLRLADEKDWRGNLVIHGLTHQHLAEILGSYRETITATLNEFKAEGYLETGRKKIVISNVDGLRALIRS
ncbi:MAG: Crp/Fnr family transcriptional regulator [Thermomicrobiales bacterium]